LAKTRIADETFFDWLKRPEYLNYVLALQLYLNFVLLFGVVLDRPWDSSVRSSIKLLLIGVFTIVWVGNLIWSKAEISSQQTRDDDIEVARENYKDLLDEFENQLLIVYKQKLSDE
jgi:hypothetical protein